MSSRVHVCAKGNRQHTHAPPQKPPKPVCGTTRDDKLLCSFGTYTDIIEHDRRCNRSMQHRASASHLAWRMGAAGTIFFWLWVASRAQNHMQYDLQIWRMDQESELCRRNIQRAHHIWLGAWVQRARIFFGCGLLVAPRNHMQYDSQIWL